MTVGGMYCIREDEARGRHVLSSSLLEKGVTVLEEEARVFYNKRDGLSSCAHCGRALGSVHGALRHATEGDEWLEGVLELIDPALSEWGSFDVNPVPCVHSCGALFCSASCQESCKFHALLCPPQMEEECSQALSAYVDTFGANDRFLFLAKHIALALCDPADNDALVLEDYDDGCMRIPVTAEVRLAVREAASLLRRVFAPALRIGGPAVTPQVILRLLNIYNVNSHSTVTLSPVHALQRRILGDEEWEGLKGSLAVIFGSAQGGARLKVRGVGLFKDAACMNHSCVPNCKTVPTTEAMKIAVITLRDIPVGEELCISYIDADTTTGRPFARERDLRAYNFTCLCSACKEERRFHAAVWMCAGLCIATHATY